MTFEEGKKCVSEWLNEVLIKGGKFSDLLVEELAIHYINRTVDVHSVFDQIGRLEDPTFRRGGGVKPATPFTGRHLKGFWHQHYFGAGHLIRNLENELSSPGSLETIRKMADAINQGQDPSPFIHELTIKGYERRHASAKLTGEWIVFAKHNGINYYLTIANHTEFDCVILDRIISCVEKFPELSKYLSNNEGD